MSLAPDAPSEPIEHQPDRAAVERHLLHCGRLPTGTREILARLLAAGDPAPTVDQMAAELGVSLSTLSLWIGRARRAGLLSVTRTGRRNCYRVHVEELQRRAERAGR